MNDRPVTTDGAGETDDPPSTDANADSDRDGDGTDGSTGRASPVDLRRTLLARLREHDRLVLCLDFDGTLADIVSDPDAATLRRGNREHLETLRAHEAVTLAVVSGRALDDVRDRVAVPGIHYVGNAGLERTDGEAVWVHPDARQAEERLARVRETLTDQLGWAAGIAVEDKRWSLAVHTRDVSPDHHDRVAETVGRVADRVGDLTVSQGHEVLEVGPDTDASKGAAVSTLADDVGDVSVAEHRRSDAERADDPLVVYVGDDHSDQTALEVAADRGVAVFVGDDGPSGAYHVDSPAAVSDLLGWLATEDVLTDGGSA